MFPHPNIHSGHQKTFLLEANITVDAKSSEEPVLNLEIVFAVVGATKIRSLHLDKDIWSISDSFS